MSHAQAYLFSPFSPYLVKSKYHSVLLLQFFLKDLIGAHQAILSQAPLKQIVSFEPRHLPYDWAKESGCLNKANEHAQLLRFAFEGFETEVEQISRILSDLLASFSQKDGLAAPDAALMKRKLKQLFRLTESLICHSKEDENLIFFLLKNRDPINTLMGTGYLRSFLSKLHEKGLEQLEKKLCDQYHDRGFFSLIPELKMRFSELNQPLPR
jgi:hypothetical protein